MYLFVVVEYVDYYTTSVFVLRAFVIARYSPARYCSARFCFCALLFARFVGAVLSCALLSGHQRGDKMGLLKEKGSVSTCPERF